MRDRLTIREFFLSPNGGSIIRDVEITGDAETFELAELIESELLDEYVLDELPPDDRRAFERNYLVTEARLVKLELTRQLVALAGTGPKAPVLRNERSREAPPFAKWAVAGLAMLLISSVIFFGIRDTGPVALPEQTVPESLVEIPPTQPVTADAPSGRTQDLAETPAVSTRTVSALQPATIILPQSRLRGSGKDITISLKEAGRPFVLKLMIESAAQTYPSYSLRIETPEGEPATTSSTIVNVTASAVTASVVGKFEAGYYIVFLLGLDKDGNGVPLAEYVFRVRE